MKKASEYFNEYSESLSGEDFYYGDCLTKETALQLIKQIQTDVIRETVTECASSLRKLSYPSTTEQEQNTILSVADKLIKEL